MKRKKSFAKKDMWISFEIKPCRRNNIFQAPPALSFMNQLQEPLLSALFLWLLGGRLRCPGILGVQPCAGPWRVQIRPVLRVAHHPFDKVRLQLHAIVFRSPSRTAQASDPSYFRSPYFRSPPFRW